MNFKKHWKSLTADQKIALAKKVKADRVYLFQIAGGQRRPSPELAMKLAAATPVPLAKLRADLWGANPPKVVIAKVA